MDMNNLVKVGGVPVLNTSAELLSYQLLNVIEKMAKISLFFANTNFIVQCQSLLDRMLDRSVIIVNDGIGMDLALMILQGGFFKHNLNGTDFTPYFLKKAGRPLKVYMLGAQPIALNKAVHHAEYNLHQIVVGHCDGYDGMQKNNGLISEINASGAEVLLVGLGSPVQEKWILDHRPKIDVPVAMGVGGLFDFWSGEKPRAPKLIQQMRLEWLYRLSLEPKRLARRYTLDIAKFLFYCQKYR